MNFHKQNHVQCMITNVILCMIKNVMQVHGRKYRKVYGITIVTQISISKRQ